MYLIRICQIIERIIHIQLSFMDANLKSSSGDIFRMAKNIVQAMGEGVTIQQGMESVVKAGFFHTDDIWRLTTVITVESDTREEKQLRENL